MRIIDILIIAILLIYFEKAIQDENTRVIALVLINIAQMISALSLIFYNSHDPLRWVIGIPLCLLGLYSMYKNFLNYL